MKKNPNLVHLNSDEVGVLTFLTLGIPTIAGLLFVLYYTVGYIDTTTKIVIGFCVATGVIAQAVMFKPTIREFIGSETRYYPMAYVVACAVAGEIIWAASGNYHAMVAAGLVAIIVAGLIAGTSRVVYLLLYQNVGWRLADWQATKRFFWRASFYDHFSADGRFEPIFGYALSDDALLFIGRPDVRAFQVSFFERSAAFFIRDMKQFLCAYDVKVSNYDVREFWGPEAFKTLPKDVQRNVVGLEGLSSRERLSLAALCPT